MPPSYLSAVVKDWDVLNARLDDVLASRGQSESTRSGYSAALNWWKGFCAENGIEPWSAPFDAWEKAVQIGRRSDGKRLGWDYYSLIERSVAREHHDRDLPPPAPRQPRHLAAWKEIGSSYRTRLNLEWSKDRETYTRDPLTREDIRSLLCVTIGDLPDRSTSPHAGRGKGVRRAAQRLVLLDTLCSANLLAKTLAAQVQVAAEGVRMQVGEQYIFLPHDHAERVFGVPWDCAACAVIERLAEVVDTPAQPLFAAGGVTDLTRQWPGLASSSSRLREVPGLSPGERAGLRRGLALSAHRPKEWAWWLVGRAWVALSWEAGFRMVGDLAGLDRSWCSPLPAGDGFRIQLHRTKDDQGGKKHVTRPLRFDPDEGPSAALMLTEYLAVRDAKIGPGGPLLWWGGDPNKQRAPRTVLAAAQRAILTLTDAAQVEGKFRSYSPRKGYSAQSAADGRSPEMRQRGLRHTSARTTLGHYPDGAGSLASNEMMMRRLVEQLEAGA